MQVEEFLEQSAERYPERTALVCRGQRLTYAEFETSCNQMANALLAHRLQRWDRVAIYMGNTVETTLAIFATLKAGGVFVLINPQTKEDKLAYILNNCRASILVTLERLLPVALAALSGVPFVGTVLVAGQSTGGVHSGSNHRAIVPIATSLAEAPSRRCPRRNIDLDLAALIYTSGSTGHPKGVMVTHLNVVSAATSITTYLKSSGDDIVLNVLPLSFDYGLYQLLMSCKVGGTLVLEPSFTYPYAVLETLVRENVTGFPIVPTICAMLLQLNLADYRFPHLRYLTNTAAALPVEHIQKLRALFPGVQLYSMYGLTECKRVSYLPPEQLDIRPASVGRGMPNEEVYIVDEKGERVPFGETGELVVRGANVMRGYWELPEETDKVLKAGCLPGEKVLYTGDLFRADEEGYLYWVARKDDIIKTRGEKVSPREVENTMYGHSRVAEAAVIGVQDDILGNAIHGFVSLKESGSVTELELLSFCAAKLEDFMVPKAIHILPSLPKSANGKIDKLALAALERITPKGLSS